MNTPAPTAPSDPHELFVFSAGDWTRLAERVRANALAESARSLPLHVLARNLASHPAEPCRLAIVARHTEDLIDKARKALQLLADGRRPLNIAHRIFADHAPDEPPRTAVLFPGFGTQYPNMLAGIYDRFPVVRRWFDGHSDEERARWRRNEFLFSDAAADPATKSRLHEDASLRHTWDASLVANLAYFTLAQHLGLRCDAIVGHSFGENAALIAGGIVGSYAPMARLLRQITSEVIDHADGESAFLAVTGPGIARWVGESAAGAELSVVLDNCPQQAIVCGSVAAIERLDRELRARGNASFRLPLLVRPVHSPRFPVPLDRMRAIYDELELGPARVPVWSCATAAPLPSAPAEVRAILTEQWVSTVRFQETVRRLHADGVRTFVEVGAGANLTGFVRDSLRGESLTVASMDREGSDTLLHLQANLALLWVRGHSLALDRLWSEAPDPIAPVMTTRAAMPPVSDRPPTRSGRQAVVERVIAQVAAVLELTDTALIDPQRGFFDLGLDSLGSVELARRLEQELGCPVPPTAAFDYSSPDRLAEHLAAVLAGSDSTRHVISARTAEADEPVAIVGMACRFPGGATDPESFWQLLRGGTDAVSTVPAGRWPERPSSGESDAVRHGAFLPDVDRFDADFFGISPREAEALDPQHRLLLEVVWEALERAGVAPRGHTAPTLGIFVGISTFDYAQRLTPRQRLEIGGYMATGNSASTAAGRLSYILGARGPSVAVDASCSSSLLAVHLAHQALRRGECDLAVACGVGLLLSSELSVYLTAAGALSRRGRCRTFDAGADGYVRGEGCGAVVLQRLPDAIATRRGVLAVLRGSAVNHDGHTSGLTVPNGRAQEEVITRALADGGVAADAVSYVEAHGTGTLLGDPIELAALGRVFGGRGAEQPRLRVASVKTNIGHLEAAAGIAGLIKVVLQLQHRELAPSLWYDTPNPHIDWTGLPIDVCRRVTPWQAAGPLVAGISSFGISGTNTHAVLQEAPPAAALATSESPRDHALLVLSARTGSALAHTAVRLADHLEGAHDLPLADVAYTTQTGRNHDRCRASIVARTRDEAVAGLRGLAERVGATEPQRGKRRLAFLFTGQGAQRPQMAQRLFASEPVFRQALTSCDAILRSHRTGSLLAVLTRPRGEELHPLDTTEWAQPALFAVGYALAELWRSWGVEPDAVLGHSVGELTAACVAGVLTLEDALALVAARGELMQSLPPGGMMAVAASAEQAFAELGVDLGGELEVAAINAPASVVLSGDRSAIVKAESRLRAAGLRATELDVLRAFHSRAMDPIADRFGQLAGRLPHRPARVPLVSNLTGTVLREISDPAGHWTRHARETVRFAAGLRAVRGAGCDVFLEMGPRPVLIGLAQESRASGGEAYLASLHPPHDDEAQMLDTLGRLYELGLDVDWPGVQAERGARSVVLPTYPFQRERLWIEPSREPASSPSRGRATHESLLGERLSLPCPNGEARFEAELSIESLGYLAEQRIAGHVSLPLPAFLDAALRTAETLEPGSGWQIERFVAHHPLVMADGLTHLLQTLIDPIEGGGFRTRFFGRRTSAGDEPWLLHADATVGRRPAASIARAVSTEPGGHADAETIEIGRDEFYDSCRQAGFDYGPHFQVLDSLQVGLTGARSVATLSTAPDAREHRERLRGLTLEAALQTLGVLVGSRDESAGFLLRDIDRVALGDPSARVQVVATLQLQAGAEAEVRADVAVLDAESGAVVGEMLGIRYAPAPTASAVSVSTGDVSRATLRERLLATVESPTGDGEAAVLAYLRQTACDVLRFPRDRALDPRQPLPEMGFDSIMGVWFRNRLQTDLGVEIEAREFLREPTLDRLTRAVIARLTGAHATTGAQPGYVEGEL